MYEFETKVLVIPSSQVVKVVVHRTGEKKKRKRTIFLIYAKLFRRSN